MPAMLGCRPVKLGCMPVKLDCRDRDQLIEKKLAQNTG